MTEELPEDIQRRMMKKLAGDKGTKGKVNRVTAEYYAVAAEDPSNPERWVITIAINGSDRRLYHMTSNEDCLSAVARLREKGIPVREFETEWMRERKKQK